MPEQSRGLTILSEQFPSVKQNPILIVGATPNGSSMLSANNLAKVDALTSWVAKQGHVAEVTSLTSARRRRRTETSASELTKMYTSGTYRQYPALVELVNSTLAVTRLITAYADTEMDSIAGKAVITTCVPRTSRRPRVFGCGGRVPGQRYGLQ